MRGQLTGRLGLILGASGALAALPAAALAQDATAVVDAANSTAYIFNTLLFLIGGFLVMWMAAGFAMLEAGFVRTKNVSMQCLKNIMLYSLAGIMFWFFGYDVLYAGVNGPGDKGKAAATYVAQQDTFGDNPPKPGEGPTKEEREAGFYEAAFYGGTKDSGADDMMVCVVTGDKDPGYGSTSKMISEAALCLTRDVDRTITPGGVYTPAPAMGNALIKRLEDHAGLTFVMEG